jgi:similar to stage IV sporulation protein
MLTSLVHRLQGQLCIRVECAFPERVLNLCAARDLSFWNLKWESATVFTCRLTRQDWRQLRQAAQSLDCTLTVVRREGAPFFLARFRHRPALLGGLTACGLALFLGSFFIWDFQVEGNVDVPTERILRAMEEYGVGIGSFGLAIDGEDLRNHVLLEVPELSWIAVNVSGCRANVQVRERIPKPELVEDAVPANIVARRSGLVLEMRALDGIAAVLPGTSVGSGQLLISGVEDTGTFGARLMAGLGSVTARTWYELETVVPLEAVEKRYTGREKTGISLRVGTRRIKFFTNSSIDGGEYDKITDTYSVSPLGIALPLTVVRERWRFYEKQPVTLRRARAEQQGEAALKAYLEAQVAPYGEILSTLCDAKQEGEVLRVILRAECREEIGRRVPIYRSESGE